MRRIHRFQNTDPRSWMIWPVLETRIINAHSTITPDTPPAQFIPILRNAFANGLMTVRCWALLDGTMKVHGHLVAFLEQYWGKYRIVVHQIVCDENVVDLQGEMMKEFDIYARELEQAGVHVEGIRFLGKDKRGLAWERHFPGAQIVIHILDVKFGDDHGRKHNGHDTDLSTRSGEASSAISERREGGIESFIAASSRPISISPAADTRDQ